MLGLWRVSNPEWDWGLIFLFQLPISATNRFKKTRVYATASERVAMSADWELSKENVAPIRSGRSVKGLSGVGGLANKPVLGKDLGAKEEEKKHEEAIAEAKTRMRKEDGSFSSEAEDMVLQAYIRYYKWVRETYKTSNDKSKAVLERVTSELKDSVELKNNEMYVKLWIELADMMRTPSEVFGFMQTNKIGEKVALFWVAWAFVAEKAEKYDVTEQIFRKAIKKLAEPKDLVQNRFNQFQRRMVSRMRNGEIPEPGQKNEQPGEGERQALSSLSRSKTSRNSSQRTGAAVSGTSGGLAKDENVRRANRDNRNGGRSVATGASSSISRTSSSRSNSGEAGAPIIASSGNFTIFADNSSSAPSLEAALAKDEPEPTAASSDDVSQGSDWKVLGHENKRTKENHVPVSTWSEAPLGKGGVKGAPAALGFSIFTDGEALQESEPPQAAHVESSINAEPEPEPGPSVEAQAQAVVEDAGKQAAPVAVRQIAGAASMTLEEHSILANLSTMDEEDGTINTRLAMGTIDAMFCDSPPQPAATVSSVEAQEREEANATGLSFTVFTDN